MESRVVPLRLRVNYLVLVLGTLATLSTAGRSSAQQPAGNCAVVNAPLSATQPQSATSADFKTAAPAGEIVPTRYEQPAPIQAAAPAQMGDLLRRLDAAEAELAAMRAGMAPRIAPEASQTATGGVVQATAQVPAPEAAGVGDVDTEARINALEKAAEAAGRTKYPLVRLSGFTQVDDGLFSQNAASRAVLGNVKDGIGFRRARLQALGSLTELTRFSVEFDFAIVGRPSFLDVWGEQSELPFFGTVRIGHFRQPTTMDALTSIRHLDFLERNAAFQGMDPFRRTGIMAYRVSDDEMSTLAYSAYATGFTFWNGVGTTYQTLGDSRFATEIGDHGGVSTAIRATHLLYYDEPSDGRYLLHVGGGYNFSVVGGQGTTGTDAKTYESRSIPEFFVGDPTSTGLTAGGTPFVIDSGRVLARNFHFFHTELAGNWGPAHFQTEFLGTELNQIGGPTIFYYGAYLQGGYFLTGENAGYNKQTGVLDYNCKPYSNFFGTGREHGMCGWGAWEVAARWTYLNIAATPTTVVNPTPATTPPIPNAGVLNESTLALNWFWNPYTRVQFNWIHSMMQYNSFGFRALDTFGSRFQIEF
jgi:phosphate-selective porin OprO/OprP